MLTTLWFSRAQNYHGNNSQKFKGSKYTTDFEIREVKSYHVILFAKILSVNTL